MYMHICMYIHIYAYMYVYACEPRMHVSACTAQNAYADFVFSSGKKCGEYILQIIHLIIQVISRMCESCLI